MTPQIFNFAKLASSLASFAVAKAVDPSGYLGDIITSIAGNLASNFITKYDPLALEKYIGGPDPELNPDIERLMIDSVPKAVELVTVKYLKENPYKDKFVKNTLKNLIQDSKNKTYEAIDNHKMLSDQESWIADIHEYIFRGYEDEDGKLIEIENFFIAHLQECYNLVFIEGLKDDKDEKPLKAFLIKSLEGLTHQASNHTVILTNINAEIQALRQERPCKSLPIAKDYFNREFNKIHQKLDKLLDITTKSAGNIELIIELLEKLAQLLKPNSTIPHHLTPPPFLPEVFLGREEELETIKHKLFTANHLLLLVNGEGGVGKTSLASKYYHIYEDKYVHIAWLLSEQSIANALLNLAKPLNVLFEDTTPQEERLEILLTAMASLPKPCLLIVDNANELEDLEENYQTLRRCPNFHILLTTRITDFHHAEQYKTKGLPELEALELFKEYYPKHKESEDELFKQIYHAVGGNTLVIEILAKNLRELNKVKKKYQLNDLLVDLQQKGLLALSQSKEIDTDYQKLKKAKPQDIIEAMYDLGQLNSSETALLSVFAVLPAESISFETLEELLPNTENLDYTLLMLAKKGWLDYNKENTAFKCSPVIQDIVQKKNSRLFEDCSDLIDILNKKLEFEFGVGSLININYEESLIYSRYAESVINNLYNITRSLSILHKRIGNYYTIYGNIEKALFFLEKDIKISEKLYENDPKKKDNKWSLAVSYQNLGNLNQSLGKLETVLSLFYKLNQLMEELHLDYPDQVDFKNGLAISYERLGEFNLSMKNFDKSLEFFQKEVKLFKKFYKDYPNEVDFKKGLATSYFKLGELNQALGKIDNALSFFLKGVNIFKELYNDYPNKINFKNALSISYLKLGEINKDLGKSNKALQFFHKDCLISEELYKDYPNQVDFKNGLAISYFKLGTSYKIINIIESYNYYKKAEELWIELLKTIPESIDYKENLLEVQEALLALE